MQVPILRALAMVAVGNAALKPQYEATMKMLFDAVSRAALVTANSTYRR